MTALYSRTDTQNRANACLSVFVRSFSPFSGSTSDYCQADYSAGMIQRQMFPTGNS